MYLIKLSNFLMKVSIYLLSFSFILFSHNILANKTLKEDSLSFFGNQNSLTEILHSSDHVFFDTTNLVVTKKTPHHSTLFIPSLPEDLIKDQLKCIEKEVPFTYNARVRDYIDYFTVRARTYFLKILNRKNVYFPIFEKKLKEHGLPDEIKYLTVIESSLKLKALSRRGALGLWQFMPATARLCNLKVGYYVDERMSPEKATEAACIYLKQLYGMFHDWELAIAAYNCGPGNVRKAMRRSGKNKFWDIYNFLPRETRNYIPQFVAVIYAMKHASEYNLIPNKLEYNIPSKSITVSQSVDLKKMAKEINICADDLYQLNPELRHKFLPIGYKNYEIQIPSKRYSFFKRHEKSILEKVKRTSSKTPYIAKSGNNSYHIVRRGETLGGIARKYGVKVSQIYSWNNLRSHRIYPRQRLYLASKGKVRTITSRKKTPTVNLKGQKVYTTQYGDSLWLIAKKYQTSVSKIKYTNGLISNKLKIGQKIIIP